MQDAINSLSNKILTLQGNGDYDGVTAWIEKDGKIGDQLQKDLDRLSEANIPTDIVFDQGLAALGLQKD